MYIGIDVGKKGGISNIDTDGSILEMLPMPDLNDLARILYDWCNHVDGPAKFAAIERVSAMPGQGVSSMFSFGKSAGYIEGVISALRVPFTLVSPQTWQKVMLVGVPKKKASKPKERSLIAARQLYPGESFIPAGCRVPHDGVYESVLLGRYARYVHKMQNM